MKWVCNPDLSYFRFPALEALPGVFHGVFPRWRVEGRHGRVTFDIGLDGAESNDVVWRNRRRVAGAFAARQMVFARQVHGVEVHCRRETKSGQSQTSSREAAVYHTCDALITDQAQSALFIQVADCQPVLCADPVKGVVANIHSGWRGSVRNIIGRVIDKMKSEYGCRGRDIFCGIGPSLGPCCAEFVHYRTEIPQKYWSYRLGDDHFDFWQMSIDQLMRAGVPAGNISLSRICTRCNQHLFFSYRGERHTGRFCSVIGLSRPS